MSLRLWVMCRDDTNQKNRTILVRQSSTYGKPSAKTPIHISDFHCSLCEELYNDAHDKHFDVKYDSERPPIMKLEVQDALKHIKSGKTPGPDNITTEMISALEDSGIDEISRLQNAIYDTGNIPPDLCKSIFPSYIPYCCIVCLSTAFYPVYN
ncbi:hypothetical protein BsWGS_09780 [Bradybaena similaris]